MNSLHAPLNGFCMEARTAQNAGCSAYTVRFAIAEQPVKPSRKAMHRVSVELLRDGLAIDDADVAIGFHPLQGQPQFQMHPTGELLLAPRHADQGQGPCFDGSLALPEGEYRVDVTINHEAHAGFVIQM